MKIKVNPDDFVVTELIDLPLSRKGAFTILELKKSYWNTLDCINYAARRLKKSKDLFSRAGLKDRYSLSTQYISFKGNLHEPIRGKNFVMTPIGKADRPILPHLMVGNRFSITLRGLEEKEIARVSRNSAEVEDYGFPNYFDDQRFGSARHGQGFFAKRLMLRHYEGALKLLLCHPYKKEGKRERTFKSCCRENWGSWSVCHPLASPAHKVLIDYLVHNPRDYKNAIKTIDRELLNIYLLAYQSFLFNLMLAMLIENYGRDLGRVSYSMGTLIFHRGLHDSRPPLSMIKLPMLNEQTVARGAVRTIVDAVLRNEGIMLKDFALSRMRFRGVRFKSFSRPAISRPMDFEVSAVQDDDLYPNKKKITLAFTLAPGCYATILVKRLFI